MIKVDIVRKIAMAGCSELKSVNIGSNLKTVGGQVFAGCTSLEKGVESVILLKVTKLF